MSTAHPLGQQGDRMAPMACRFPLFADVRIIRRLQVEGEDLPAGAAGTVVEILGDGTAYVVEFFDPIHAVVTAHDLMLAALEA